MATTLASSQVGKAAIFDLDEVLLDRRQAWRYTIEQAVAAITHRRLDASSLVEPFYRRPWSHALRVLLVSPRDVARCEAACQRMYERSSLKRLLVHEGIGMALDALRGRLIDIGAISRSPRGLAQKQIESTGLDRFVDILAPTPEHCPWSPTDRYQECRAFLRHAPAHCAFVGADERDVAEISAAGAPAWLATWPGWSASAGVTSLAGPGDLAHLAWPPRPTGNTRLGYEAPVDTGL